MTGWIKLHRKTLDNPVVCKDSDYFIVWCYLLLNATHKEINVLFKGIKITLRPGQLLTGRKSISSKLNISESKIQRILKSFEIEHQIEQQTSNQNRLISILSWNDYQVIEHQTEQQVNNERTQTRRYKNEKKIDSDLFELFWKSYPRKTAKAVAKKSFDKLQVDGPMLEQILKAIDKQKLSRQWNDVNFIPHASTWLNQKRFEDEEETEIAQEGLTMTADGSFKF
jgi:Zn-finger nucleic acid-binding protein